MLDIKFVRENPDAIDAAMANRQTSWDREKFFELDDERRAVITEVEELQATRNAESKKIGALMKEGKKDEAEAAKEAGADYVGEADLAQKIQQENWFDFDVVVATPDMMGVVGRLGKVLGPKGLMPSPKAGTVTMDVTKAVNEIKAGKVEYRLDKTNIIHCPIGKASFGPEKLAENFNALMGAIIKAKPAAAKGQYIKSCVAASTMGPGVKMNANKQL